MITNDLVLLASGLLFVLGLVGTIRQRSVICILVSIEVMIFASVINFCFVAGDNLIRSGHIAALISVVLGSVSCSVIYALYMVLSKQPNLGEFYYKKRE